MVAIIKPVKEVVIYKIFNLEEDVQNVLVLGRIELFGIRNQVNDVSIDQDP